MPHDQQGTAGDSEAFSKSASRAVNQAHIRFVALCIALRGGEEGLGALGKYLSDALSSSSFILQVWRGELGELSGHPFLHGLLCFRVVITHCLLQSLLVVRRWRRGVGGKLPVP